MVGLRGRGLSSEPVPVHTTASRGLFVVMDAQVGDLKTDDVVKEVSALAGLHVHSRKRGLDDHLGPCYLPPLDGNAEPTRR
jgi:hypothetical protein